MRTAAVSLLLLGSVALAQDQQDARPVFRSGVSLVRLDVRVVGRDGKPISDLRPDEVQISEGGTARPIVLFQRVTGPGGSYVEMAQRTIASDVSTNQGAPQGQLYVLVFDQDHIRPGGELAVRIAAETFLRTRVRPQDRVAIFGLPGPGPAQPFTANLGFARKQLDLIRSGLVRNANGAVTEMTEHDAYEILRGNEYILTRYTTVESGTAATSSAGGGAADVARRVSDDPVVLRRLVRENAQSIANRADAESRLFLRALADLLRGFRGIDGRKTVLLFSEGFYGDNVSRDVEDVAAAAAETYSVVYAFDLNKRAGGPDASSSSTDDASDTLSRLEPLGGLAAETSGDLLKDASVRLDAAFASLLPDDGSYYLLGFEPGVAAAGDSIYRRVKVSVRRPGARVVSRTGYALGIAPTPGDRRRAIDTALAAPFTQQSLKIEYTTYVGQSAMTAGAQRVVVSLLAELPVRRTGAAPAPSTDDMADVVFVVRDTRTGRTVASGSDHIALPDHAEDGQSTGSAPWRVAFDVSAGDYVMRCVVREPGGIVGSSDRRFTVRSLNGFDVAATDFVVASPGDTFPVRARAYTEGLLTGTLRLYGATGDQLEGVTARLELRPADDDPALNTGRVGEGAVGEVISAGARSMRDVLFSVPLERLAAGVYVAHVTVKAKGEVVADLRRPVEIVTGPAPAPAAVASNRPRSVLDSDIARRLIRQAADSQNDEVRRGLADLDRENYASAAAILGLAFDAHPDDAALAFVLGWARVGAGNRTGAVTAFRNAALLEPAMVPAHLALVDSYVALGHVDLAVQAVDAGLRAAPNSIELKRLLALLKR